MCVFKILEIKAMSEIAVKEEKASEKAKMDEWALQKLSSTPGSRKFVENLTKKEEEEKQMKVRHK